MGKNRVVVGRVYEYHRAGFDLFDPKTPVIQAGTMVRVVNLPGCPKANAMGQCHVNDVDGRFLGMVDTSSLQTVRASSRPATADELAQGAPAFPDSKFNVRGAR